MENRSNRMLWTKRVILKRMSDRFVEYIPLSLCRESGIDFFAFLRLESSCNCFSSVSLILLSSMGFTFLVIFRQCAGRDRVRYGLAYIVNGS